jgi:hypothetical protein
MGYCVSIEEEIAAMDTDEERYEGDENGGNEDGIGLAGDYGADGFGISGNPDGGLAEGARA